MLQNPNAEIAELEFCRSFIGALPGDNETENFRRQVLGACYSSVRPTPVGKPKLLISSAELSQELGLPDSIWQVPEFLDTLAGNALLTGMQPYAMCYGGHQFGHWAGQLGDGRAINLGEQKTAHQSLQTWQLKGAGPTPYSRSADGLAVLRSSIREFLCSEAMHHLGVPTTRALSLVSTGNEVLRDMFYDGHPALEPGAVVCRIAPSFIRFGNFELHAARGERDLVKRLADYTIEHYFPKLHQLPEDRRYVDWFEEITQRTLTMIIHWQRVGFVHGVMNTDNMSIHGLTIDYGPYGWLEDYNPGWTPNTTDRERHRYCYGNQPAIAQWNLWQLANALCSIVENPQPLEKILAAYKTDFDAQYKTMLANKLGLSECADSLVAELLQLLEKTQADYTLFFRALMHYPAVPISDLTPLQDCFYRSPDETEEYQWHAWLKHYRDALDQNSYSPDRSLELMAKNNPQYVLRNYMAQMAIEQAELGELDLLHELHGLLKNPYQSEAGSERWAQKRPDWAEHKAGCSMLSCSS